MLNVQAAEIHPHLQKGAFFRPVRHKLHETPHGLQQQLGG